MRNTKEYLVAIAEADQFVADSIKDAKIPDDVSDEIGHFLVDPHGQVAQMRHRIKYLMNCPESKMPRRRLMFELRQLFSLASEVDAYLDAIINKAPFFANFED